FRPSCEFSLWLGSYQPGGFGGEAEGDACIRRGGGGRRHRGSGHAAPQQLGVETEAVELRYRDEAAARRQLVERQGPRAARQDVPPLDLRPRRLLGEEDVGAEQ